LSFSDKQLIFVVSQPRSGSTLFQSLLNNHPAIATLPETWLMLHLLAPVAQKPLGDTMCLRAISNFLAALPDDSYYPAVREMAYQLYGAAVNGEARFFMDKTPRYYSILPELKKTFPNALTIILHRNPLAVLVSMLTSSRDSWAHLPFYKADLLDAPRLLADASALHLHYEKLLENPKSIAPVYEALGLAMPDNIESFVRPEAAGENAVMGDMKIQKKSSIEAKNASKWLESLRDAQAWRFANDYLAYLGAELVEKLGYDFAELEAQLAQYRPKSLINTVSLEWAVHQASVDACKRSWQFQRYRVLRRLAKF
jgi:hypothetical protein